MDKRKKRIRFILEGGLKAAIAFVIAQGIFVILATVAGVVGILIGNWGIGIVCVIVAFTLLNYLALFEVVEAVFAKLSATGGSEQSRSEQVRDCDRRM